MRRNGAQKAERYRPPPWGTKGKTSRGTKRMLNQVRLRGLIGVRGVAGGAPLKASMPLIQIGR